MHVCTNAHMHRQLSLHLWLLLLRTLLLSLSIEGGKHHSNQSNCMAHLGQNWLNIPEQPRLSHFWQIPTICVTHMSAVTLSGALHNKHDRCILVSQQQKQTKGSRKSPLPHPNAPPSGKCTTGTIRDFP
mmetsp:Transcript_49820/g.89119  ORF Transcript_49820/g.89119 Transcript_49820/m.89119 type:complete len:129 (+) Transcript_49820:624-1010(+)